MDLKTFLDKETIVKYDKLVKITMDRLSGERYEDDEKEDQGYIFLNGFEPDTARYVFKEWKNMKNNGVYICSFPKTGLNWTCNIVRNLLYAHDKEQLAIAKALPMPLNSIEFSDKTKFDILDQIPLERNLLCSHLPEALFDVGHVLRKKGKIIYLYWNPKDQAVSWFHFSQSGIFKYKPYTTEWNEFIEDYMNGKHHMHSKDGEFYPEHIRGWYKHKGNPNVLFVCFEELKRDFPKQIRTIGNFLEVSMTEKIVEDVAYLCSFQYMQSQYVGYRKKFVRSGKVGEWKHKFTVAQSEKMDKIFSTRLQGVDLEFIYEL